MLEDAMLQEGLVQRGSIMPQEQNDARLTAVVIAKGLTNAVPVLPMRADWHSGRDQFRLMECRASCAAGYVHLWPCHPRPASRRRRWGSGRPQAHCLPESAWSPAAHAADK